MPPTADAAGARRVDWDRSFITRRAYSTDEKLATRQSIYAYSKPTGEPGFFAWGTSRIAWSGGELVVDVGCGNGMWLKRLAEAFPGVRTVGFDLSEGMLQSLRARYDATSGPSIAVVDAEALPLRDHTVDVVLLMQMLHHVPNRSFALVETRRVLRPEGGAALVSTPGSQHLHELRDLMRSAIVEVRGQEIDGPFLENPFDADRAAAELPETFSAVESYVGKGALEIPEADPVVAHLDSQQAPDLDALLPSTATWDEVLVVARGKAERAIQADGAFRVTTEVGAFVCRP